MSFRSAFSMSCRFTLPHTTFVKTSTALGSSSGMTSAYTFSLG